MHFTVAKGWELMRRGVHTAIKFVCEVQPSAPRRLHLEVLDVR